MSRISWGKPRIFVKDVDASGSSWEELYTPAEDSTQLTASKGDKMEARIEGGGVEDVKYKRATYQLAYNIRKGKRPTEGGTTAMRKLPFKSLDGYVDHQYAVILAPEDTSCEGFLIEYTTVTIDDTYSSAEGGMWQVLMDALRPASGDTVKWGIVTITEQGATHTIAFEEGTSFDSGEGVEPSTKKTIEAVSFTPAGNSEVTGGS